MSEAFVSGGGEKGERRYGWRKNSYSLGTSGTATIAVGAGVQLYYSDTITFNEQTKIVTLNNPIGIVASNNVGLNLAGKYVGVSQSAMLSDSVGASAFGKVKGVVEQWVFSGTFYGFSYADNLLILVDTIPTCVVDDNANAYPSNGYKDGHKYVPVVT